MTLAEWCMVLALCLGGDHGLVVYSPDLESKVCRVRMRGPGVLGLDQLDLAADKKRIEAHAKQCLSKKGPGKG
jgi:hypothetical protein